MSRGKKVLPLVSEYIKIEYCNIDQFIAEEWFREESKESRRVVWRRKQRKSSLAVFQALDFELPCFI